TTIAPAVFDRSMWPRERTAYLRCQNLFGSFRKIVKRYLPRNLSIMGKIQMTSDRVVKSIHTVLFTVVLLLAGAAVAQTPGQMPQSANIPKNMKQYFLCLLTKGEKWVPVQFADPAMQDHLAFIREQIEAGRFVMAGPVVDQGRIGGMAIINTSSLEEATKIVDGDRMGERGRLAAEIHPVMLADLSGLHVEYPEKVK